ncbi:uromodulin-like [Cottoperca gobio]|uniref:Uromodulin-like n=1 Tax=Cottoperca gobio TaxID=56716 RepID=A0A6J2PSG8_COTGO|nr:uromodulin-like [Cottoperca gobio]
MTPSETISFVPGVLLPLVMSRRVRFSALLFNLQNDQPNLFHHCTLCMCDKRIHNCVPRCRRRTYRSPVYQDPIHSITIGPITFK